MTTPKAIIEPLLSLHIRSANGVFHPGDRLECEYQVDAVQPLDIQAVEASVMWFTEGKGDEDFGVHYFERYTPSDAIDGDLRHLHLLRTDLPNSPLSYNGAIVKIRWCVRVRLFWGRRKETYVDRFFQLAAAPRRGRAAS